MRKTILVLTTCTALALAGCGGDPEPGPAATTAGMAHSPTADSDAATVAQWASLVAPLAREWNDQVATVDDNCGDPLTILACQIGYLTLSTQAETYAIIIDGALNNPDHPDYLGEPPTEIARLVRDTIDAASAVEPAVTAYTDTGCGDPRSLDCGLAESLVMEMATDDLTEAFDAWAPYM